MSEMLPNVEIDADIVRSRLSYDPATGEFQWKECLSPGIQRGDPAGGMNGCGYIQIWLYGKKYKAHRLAWLYVFGEWPSGEIDHINRVRHDNRIDNLRDVSHSINMRNLDAGKRRKTPPRRRAVRTHKGSVRQRGERFEARIGSGISGKHVHLGMFDTRDAAIERIQRHLAEVVG